MNKLLINSYYVNLNLAPCLCFAKGPLRFKKLVDRCL